MMEESVVNLELDFKRISNDLNFVSHRLLEKRIDAPDIIGLQSRVQQLEMRVAATSKKIECLLSQRVSSTTCCSESLLRNYELLGNLFLSNGFDITEIEDIDLRHRVELLNSLSMFPATKSSVFLSEETIQENDNHVAKTNGKFLKTSENFLFGELTEEKFESLPKSVKGRCKYEDVRKLYDKLLVEYKKGNNSSLPNNNMKQHIKPAQVIPFHELDAAGIKVIGKTGESVVVSLRTLNIINVLKNGVQLKLKGAANL